MLEQLIFINNPEQIKHMGVIEQTIKPHQKSRLFFHLINKTGHSVFVKVTISEGSFLSGISTDMEPGVAGAEAAQIFLSSNATPVNYQRTMRNQETISGIIEGEVENTATFQCQFGTGPVIKEKVLVESATTNNISLSNSAVLRLGVASKIDGDYGITQRITFNPSKPGTLSIIADPRGGATIIVYKLNGKIYRTKLLKARHKYFLQAIPLKSPVVLELIMIGGYSAPINLEFHWFPLIN